MAPARRSKRAGRSAPIQIRLLGSLEVLRDSRPLALPTSKKTRALLAYLIAAPGRHSRTELCELLWDGPDDPRAALRWSLTKLRQLVDDPHTTRLVSDRHEAIFEPRGAEIDLMAVRHDVGAGPATAAIDALKRAAAGFRGEFLEALDLPDCYRYHEWWTAERESVRALRVAILSELVCRLREMPDAALTYARAHVVVDPLSEAAHIAVIELLGRLGRVREGLQQYESCRRVLEGQLGTKPSAALERARGALGSERLRHAQPGRAPALGGAGVPPRPLFGREAERRQIDTIVSAAATGRNRDVLWVTGEAGIGKTRLLEEVASQMRALGGTVLAGRAYEAEMVRPYGAWIDALRSGALTPADPALRVDLAPLLPEFGDAPSGGDRNRLFDAVTRLLAGASSAMAPLGLVLDDVQWFDEASAGLLHFVARELTGSRVLIACAARSSEMNDNAAVVSVIRALQREGRLRHLALEPLNAPAIRELVTALDERVDANRVATESEGNALFAIEMTRALARGGALLSESIERLIADRLVHLGDRAQDLVPWASAFGKSFPPEILRLVSGLAPAELLGGMEELERRGVIRPSPSAAAYDFTHDLIRQVAYRQLSGPRRRVVHLQLARTLGALPDPDSALAGEIAHHAGLGGDAELAARAALAAGERSLRIFAYAEAYALAERGIQHAHDLARGLRIRLQMALFGVAVQACVGVPNARDLDSDISRLVIEAQEAGLAPEVAAGFFLLSFRHHVGGNFAAAHHETLRAAEAGRAADPATTARTLGNTGRCLALLEREIPRAKALLNEAKTLACQAGLEGLKDVPWGLGLVQAFLGEHDEAIRLLESAFALARGERDHWAECQCLQRAALVELERGRPEAARPYIGSLAAVAQKMGEGSEAPFAQALDALAALMLDEPGADDRTGRAIAALRAIDAKALLARTLTMAATVDFAQGRLDQAEARAREAQRSAEIVGHASERVIALAILARVALMRSDQPAAARHVETATAQLTGPHAVSLYARQMLLKAAPATP